MKQSRRREQSVYGSACWPLPTRANILIDEALILDDIDCEDNAPILDNLSSIIKRNASSVFVTELTSYTIDKNSTIPDSPTASLSNVEDIASPPSTPSSSSSKQKRSDVMKEKSRKIHRLESKDNQRKYRVNRGLEYISRKGKVNPRKKLKPPCPQSCRQQCYNKISEESRQKIFDLFWSIGDHRRQWEFITKYIEKVPKARVTSEKSKRLYTFKYSLPKIPPDDNVNENKIPVCKLNNVNLSVFIATEITLTNGKTFLMINGYTFSKIIESKVGIRYKCTLTSTCRSFATISKEGKIVRLVEKHKHPAPKYMKNENGLYFKLNKIK
ncbi:unnamed protein product [Colias eurytheme]|nr:unnamed protein product [Colias eurytheme]